MISLADKPFGTSKAPTSLSATVKLCASRSDSGSEDPGRPGCSDRTLSLTRPGDCDRIGPGQGQLYY